MCSEQSSLGSILKFHNKMHLDVMQLVTDSHLLPSPVFKQDDRLKLLLGYRTGLRESSIKLGGNSSSLGMFPVLFTVRANVILLSLLLCLL